MKIVLAFDSFKHMLAAAGVCDTVSEAIAEELPQAQILKLPIADGGEGTIDAMLSAAGGKKVNHAVKGSGFDEVESYYGILDSGVAIIEMASICGLMMASKPNPEKTTSYGVGQMIKKALDDGCKKLILCIGGTATNDGGIGAMSALGVNFYDCNGNSVVPCGESLSRIVSVDSANIDPRLRSLEILIACDVDNPLYGKNGAAYVFAPQKGADADMCARLDKGLEHYSKILYEHTKKDVSKIPGSGAAGGIAASFIAFCGASLRPGIALVLEAIGFDEKIANADIIITGEGKTDSQTLGGKAVLGISRRAKKQGIPVVVISGAVEGDVDEALYCEGVFAVFSSTRMTKPFEEIKLDSPNWLKLAAKNVVRIYFRNHYANVNRSKNDERS